MRPAAHNDHVLMSEHAYYDRSESSSSIVSPKYHGPIILGALIFSICLAKLGYSLIKRRSVKAASRPMADQIV